MSHIERGLSASRMLTDVSGKYTAAGMIEEKAFRFRHTMKNILAAGTLTYQQQIEDGWLRC
jgi:hypothetical protein